MKNEKKDNLESVDELIKKLDLIARHHKVTTEVSEQKNEQLEEIYGVDLSELKTKVKQENQL
jgi:hypothetical protein